MPIYDWHCNICGHEWEEITKVDAIPLSCPIELRKSPDLTELIQKHSDTRWTDDMGSRFKKLPSSFPVHGSWSQWRSIS